MSMEWYKVQLPIRTRISYFISGLRDLTQTWIWICGECEGHYEYHSWFGPMGRFASMLSMVDTAIRGHVYGLRPLESTPNIREREGQEEN